MRLTNLDSFNCTNHPSRDGVGICMGCRMVICEECSTKLDGINTCIDCLNLKIAKAKPKSHWFGRIANQLFGMLALLLGIATLFASLFGIGMSIPNAEGWDVGNRLFANRNKMAIVKVALETFQRDTGEYPTEERGFRALEWDLFFDDEPPQGFREERSYYEQWSLPGEVQTSGGTPIDAYGTPMRYIVDARLDGPIVLSAGPDKVFETEIEDIFEMLDEAAGKMGFDGGVPISGRGDDMLVVVK